MYYSEMTYFARVVTIVEIAEYAEPRTALELIRAFMDNQMSTKEIDDKLTEGVNA